MPIPHHPFPPKLGIPDCYGCNLTHEVLHKRQLPNGLIIHYRTTHAFTHEVIWELSPQECAAAGIAYKPWVPPAKDEIGTDFGGDIILTTDIAKIKASQKVRNERRRKKPRPSPDELREIWNKCRSIKGVARVLNVHPNTSKQWLTEAKVI